MLTSIDSRTEPGGSETALSPPSSLVKEPPLSRRRRQWRGRRGLAPSAKHDCVATRAERDAFGGIVDEREWCPAKSQVSPSSTVTASSTFLSMLRGPCPQGPWSPGSVTAKGERMLAIHVPSYRSHSVEPSHQKSQLCLPCIPLRSPSCEMKAPGPFLNAYTCLQKMLKGMGGGIQGSSQHLFQLSSIPCFEWPHLPYTSSPFPSSKLTLDLL